MEYRDSSIWPPEDGAGRLGMATRRSLTQDEINEHMALWAEDGWVLHSRQVMPVDYPTTSGPGRFWAYAFVWQRDTIAKSGEA